jgi:cation diffusion facilitator CzcD-associated flavoprotein CzcO
MSAPREVEHLDVLVVGAGLSGVAAAHHLQATCPWARYAIFEARDAIGGTWDLFRYPGVRSDSDMYTLGYSFRPWRGEKAIADGDDIRDYIRQTAAEEGIAENIRFGHRIRTANWSSREGRWRIVAERVESGESIELTCGFLFSCCGYYRYDHGYTPELAGREEFAGQIIHPQHWPEDLDWDNKRIVVIGSGATAVTLIPALATTAAHVTMLQRSPTYIAAVPPQSPITRLLGKLPPNWSGAAIRWFHALATQAFFVFCRRWPQAARKLLRKGLEAQLPRDYDIDTHFTPSYNPWEQRLCAAPGGDFFACIRNGKASVVTDRIDRFTSTGIRTESGEDLDADIVITATGLELLFIGGIEVSVDDKPIDLPSKLVYKGMMLEGVPNFALAVGYTNASWTLKCELTCDFVARLVDELRRRGYAQCTPVNRDGEVSPEPLLGLTSGYLTRSAHKFPRQGDRHPWRVQQSYWRDYRLIKKGPVIDEGLELSLPGVNSGVRCDLQGRDPAAEDLSKRRPRTQILDDGVGEGLRS